MKKKNCLLGLIFTLTSCNTVNYRAVSFTVPCEIIDFDVVFPLDTLTNLTMYEEEKLNEVKTGFSNAITFESRLFDRYHEYFATDNLKTINDSIGSGEPIEVDRDLIKLLELGIDLTKITKGAFNIAMGSLIDLYAPLYDTNEINLLPSNEKIEKALASIPSYEDIDDVIVIDKENKTVTLNKYNDNDVVISLGGIAKGYALDVAYSYLKQFNYPCIFDSGSSSMAMIGNNPLKKTGSYTISFRNPNNPSTLLPPISLNGDHFISTSGSYEKYFEYEDNGTIKKMHHIYDANTGYSNDYIQSVSLVSNNCSLAILDALTTAIFNIQDKDEILSLISTIKETYNCNLSFIMINQNNVTMSKSFKDIMVSDFDDSYNVTVIDNY